MIAESRALWWGANGAAGAAILALGLAWWLDSLDLLVLAALLALAAAGAGLQLIDEQTPELHPLDPYPEELRRRLAAGALERDEDRTERGAR